MTHTLLPRLLVTDPRPLTPAQTSTPRLLQSDVNLRRSLLKLADMSDPPITFSLPAQVVVFT